ncbi:MAG: hypothetical protein AAB819_03130, partial [Patescibacteria group bacterium]
SFERVIGETPASPTCLLEVMLGSDFIAGRETEKPDISLCLGGEERRLNSGRGECAVIVGASVVSPAFFLLMSSNRFVI